MDHISDLRPSCVKSGPRFIQVKSKMESLLASYNIEFKSFQEMLNKNKAIVAGSSALAHYLKQEGVDPGFEPNDLDIFLPGRQAVYTVGGEPTIRIKSLDFVTDKLATMGFKPNDKFGKIENEVNYYSSITALLKVVSFNNDAGKEIQVIVIHTNDIKKHIESEFDLSACISYWNSEKNTFETFDPYHTKRKEIYMMREPSDDPKIQAKDKMRCEKYAARGFKLIEKPCPFVDGRDTRHQLSHEKFEGIDVMDIFTLDEMSIRDYLQKSDWNIAIKAGAAYYAFNRNALMDYMKKKESNIGRIGKVFETPFNQCITLEAYHQLRYADYSIYELKSAYSVPTYGGRVKSMFHLSCYSVKDWIDGKEGGLVQMPPQHLAAAAPVVKRIVRRGEPLPPQTAARAYNGDVLEVGIDDILAAHAHLMVPGNLEAFHAAVREIQGDV